MDEVICFGWSNSKKQGLSASKTVSPTIKATRCGEPAVSYSIDCRNLYLNKEKSGTLQSKNNGGHSLNFINPVVIALEGNGARPSHQGGV